ncbi:MAG: HEAT repeat domain-containing protein, partial [Nannocystaceae bacterium]
EIYLQAQIEVPTGLRPVLGGVIHATVILEREGDGDGDGESLDEDVAAAAARAFAVLDTRLALARGNPDAVRELLRSDDPELVVLALEWIREHTPADFSADLLALLEHGDARVATLAVECLGYAGDPGLALAIIRHARPMSREHTREVYRALARLRGAESLGYLRFAAANEDDSILREEAERSLRLALTGIPAEPPVSQRGAERLARGHRQ